jgi:hypothetical protein
MNRPLFVVLAVAIALSCALPAMSEAKMTRAEKGSYRVDRSLDRQAYHRESVADRQQYRSEMRESRQDFANADSQQERQQIRYQVREEKREFKVDQQGDFLHERRQDRQQLKIDVVD